MKGSILVGAALLLTWPAFAADVGISISIGEPGFYGRIDIGNYPQPQLIYRQPVFVVPVPMDRPPIYLRVPPGHAKHWSKHCHRYDACGERVYFVRDQWYQQEYVPRYREQERGRGEYRDEDRGKGHRGGRHDEDRGRGR